MWTAAQRRGPLAWSGRVKHDCGGRRGPSVTNTAVDGTISPEENIIHMEYLLISYARRISGPFLRFSLAVILAWIGALKFIDPSPVLGLLQAGQLLLKDLGLMAAAVNVIAMAPVGEPRKVAAQAVTA
ncbi:MAG: hypothetical protein JO352_09945 [Chloroflexi bacterium]|nr:hypothetical protein [Chloroflexota bacterium]MBV9601365.1 hypothetical protein [Chloroflexota bacterium]